jgi:Leucine-rich repeat (LRR) protein
MEQIIKDISIHIFNFLPINDIYSLGLVNGKFQKEYAREVNWKNLLERDFYNDYDLGEMTNYENYKYWFRVKKLGIELQLNKSNREIINLQKLNLSGRHLQSLPKEIGLLTNLTCLGLHNNQLQSLPLELWSLPNLQLLSLNKNQLQCISPEIGQLVNLKTLYLSNNQLKSLPNEIKYLVNLELLHLMENPLESLPMGMESLVKLRELSLFNDYLEYEVRKILPNVYVY